MKPIASRSLARLLAPAALLGALLPLAAHADPQDFPGDRHVFQGGRPVFPGNPQEQPGGMHWQSDVDDTVVVYIHRRDVRTETRSGKSARDVDARLFGWLPERPVAVFLRHEEGRGHVRIVQQPSPENDWTAAVRIHDPQPGRSHYEFELGWQDVGRPARVFDGGLDRD